ncbi:ABC transporter ATP-binding protein [Paenibacillus thailandensis]|uniref:ABC transporter ATP-binding protein n=1 Tax=Paenibacillus thailandensis TaxID=393250 RepID=A0ABW5QWU2_9BACL
MEQSQTAIALDQVSLQRQRFQLGPVSLAIPQGYVTAIVGPNGSGKSTLFRMMLDLVKPERGTIRLLDHQVGTAGDTSLKQRIGYLAEGPTVGEDNMTGAFKTAFVRRWYSGWDDRHYRDLLAMFEVDDSLKLGKMSKGMRRKYDFALALAHRPELLLLDEPSSGLDPLAWRTMLEVLHRYMEDGDRTILMASHVVEEVRRLADYIVFMAGGEVLGMYEKDELLGRWQILFVQGTGLTSGGAAGMPGLCELAPAGQAWRVVTREAYDAERWCAENDIDITHRQPMGLDDILAELMKQKKTGGRMNTGSGGIV